MCLQTRESRRSWEKAFCSEIIVPVITVRKIDSDFFLSVLLIHLLHMIFMRMIIVLVWLWFVQYIPSILTRISKTPQDFWWETRDLVRFFTLLVDAVKYTRQAYDRTGTSGLEGLVLSLKEALPQP